jgi:hypothetical protein
VTSWWRQSGHRVNVADIEDIVEDRPDVVVFGKGQPGLMKATNDPPLTCNVNIFNLSL